MEVIFGLLILLCLSTCLVYVNDNCLNTKFFKILLTFVYSIIICAMAVD